MAEKFYLAAAVWCPLQLVFHPPWGSSRSACCGRGRPALQRSWRNPWWWCGGGAGPACSGTRTVCPCAHVTTMVLGRLGSGQRSLSGSVTDQVTRDESSSELRHHSACTNHSVSLCQCVCLHYPVSAPLAPAPSSSAQARSWQHTNMAASLPSTSQPRRHSHPLPPFRPTYFPLG